MGDPPGVELRVSAPRIFPVQAGTYRRSGHTGAPVCLCKIEGYKQLLEAERSFRDLKGVLRLRPVFHSKDERIRAHILICFLALVVVRLAETRTGEPGAASVKLGSIRQGLFTGQDGQFTQTTELTHRQRELHTALGVPEPPRFGHITPA